MHNEKGQEENKNNHRIANIIAKNPHDSNKTFKTVKILNRQELGNQYAHDKKGKPLLNPQNIYEVRISHFENHFYENNILELFPFKGYKRPLNIPIASEETQSAIIKLSNNCATGPDKMN